MIVLRGYVAYRQYKQGRTSVTSCQAGDVAQNLLCQLRTKVSESPLEAMAVWPEVLDPRFISMTHVIRCEGKILYIAVHNTTLLQIFHQPAYKAGLLAAIQAKGANVIDIVFRIG